MEQQPGGILDYSLQGGARRGCPRRHGDGEDRISHLPDELLLQVLVGLGSATEAARSSILARRWRRRGAPFWAELPVLVFRGVKPDKLRDLLARASCPQLRRLEIHVPRQDGGVAAAEVSSLLRAAEERNPAEFIFVVGGRSDEGLPFELPCFERATSIELQIWDRWFTLPPEGQFSNLERLTLTLCCVDPSVFLGRCPRLRKLVMGCYWMHDAVSIHSRSLEELVLKDTPLQVSFSAPRHVDIDAPLLNKFKLLSCGNRDLVMTRFAAPMVENLTYKYGSVSSHSVGYATMWHLQNLTVAMEWSSKYGQVHRVRVRILSLVIIANTYANNFHAKRSFAEEIACLPVNNISVLKLELRTEGRGFGSLVIHLLKALNHIQQLQLSLSRNMKPFSKDGIVSGSQYVSLTDLEEVEIEGFNLIDHDIGFLKLLLKSAPVLKMVQIQLSNVNSQSDLRYKKLCGLFRENDSVEFYVNGKLEAF